MNDVIVIVGMTPVVMAGAGIADTLRNACRRPAHSLRAALPWSSAAR